MDLSRVTVDVVEQAGHCCQLLMAISFPVPVGLLDLLRDFTVAVVKEKPDYLEEFAAEYFIQMLAKRESGDEGSVECSKTRSFLEFDETMFGGGYYHGDDDQAASQVLTTEWC